MVFLSTEHGPQAMRASLANTVRVYLYLTMVHLLNATADLDQAQLERKIRLLSLTTLAFQNIGRDLPYSAIAETLQVDPTEVERWVIDGA